MGEANYNKYYLYCFQLSSAFDVKPGVPKCCQLNQILWWLLPEQQQRRGSKWRTCEGMCGSSGGSSEKSCWTCQQGYA